jgi:hypothetical protein
MAIITTIIKKKPCFNRLQKDEGILEKTGFPFYAQLSVYMIHSDLKTKLKVRDYSIFEKNSEFSKLFLE